MLSRSAKVRLCFPSLFRCAAQGLTVGLRLGGCWLCRLSSALRASLRTVLSLATPPSS